MSPELVKAIAERISSGQQKEEIKAAVIALGHTPEVFEAAYTLAQHDLSSPGTNTDGVLPRASELVLDGWNFFCSHLHLSILLLVPGILSVIVTFLGETYSSLPWVSIIASIGELLAALLYLYGVMALWYIVSRDTATTYTQAFAWVGKHLFSFIWLSILSVLVMLGGVLFFLVPGLIVLVMVSFSQYAFVLEDKRGMAALLRSRELVHGRFWSVTTLLGKVWILMCLPIFLGAILVGMASVFGEWSDTVYSGLLGNLLLECAIVIINIVSVHAMFRLYRALQVRETLPATASVKLRYWLLVGFGAVIIPLIFVFLVFKHGADTLYEEIPALSDSSRIQNEIRSTSLPALEYFLAHNQSYEGVCDALVPTITDGEEVKCNDDETAWAISAKVGEEYWCADVETDLKKVQTDLADRTTCLPLP